MPRNKTGGKKHKQRANRATGSESTRVLRFKEDQEDYAKIIKALGNCRFQVICGDGKERMAHIPGSLRKSDRFDTNSYVLVSLRDFQDEKTDILCKYTPQEVSKLIKLGEPIPKDGEATSQIILDDDDIMNI